MTQTLLIKWMATKDIHPIDFTINNEEISPQILAIETPLQEVEKIYI